MFDAISSDTLAALLLVIVVLNFKRIGTFFNVSKVRLRSADWAPVDRAEVPARIAHLLACSESALKAIGFEFVATLAAEPLNVFDPRARIFGELYWHAGAGVLAGAELAEPLSGQVTKVHFMTAFSDGTLLLTVNRERFMQLPAPGEVLVVDAYADDLGGQWQAHREAMAREAAHRAPLSERSEAIRRHAELGPARWIAHMREIGWVREVSSGQYRFTASGAWRYAAQLARPPAVARKALVRPYLHEPAPDIKAARLAEMDSVAANIALAAQPFPAWIKATLFALTLALSAILFGRGFGPIDAAALLSVLIIHEFGHLAAMWAFDYRNLSVFFLPFLGAAATGHKPHATPWQEAIVLLAGPVPGLMLAFVAVLIPSEALPLPVIEFIRDFVWFGLILNLFNLLPFGMLDGGRLFELAVLGRFPYARVAFAFFGAALGLLYAVWMESVVLGLAMIMLLASTRLQARAAGIISSIRARAKAAGVKQLGGEMAIAALGREFARKDYGGGSAQGWMQRLNIARLAYPRLLQGIPGIGVTVGALFAQGSALLLPLTLVVWSLQQPEPMPLMRTTAAEDQITERLRAESRQNPRAQAARDAFVARYQVEADPDAKWAMLEKHEHEMAEDAGFDEAHAKWMDQQRGVLLEQLPPDHPARLRQQLELALRGSAGATDGILQIISRLTEDGTRSATDLDEERFLLLLDAYRQLAEEASPDVLERHAAELDASWAALVSPGHVLAAHRPLVASVRARLAFYAGRVDEADAWMERYQETAGPDVDLALLARAWMLLDGGHNDRALALATSAIGKAEAPAFSRANWRTVAGWAEMGRGNPSAADAHFQAVLDERTAARREARDSLPWWLRLVSRSTDATSAAPKRIDASTLDHLVALEGYAPPQAARIKAELGALSSDGRPRSFPYIASTFDGWGKAREAAHKKMLGALGFGEGNTATAASGRRR